MLRSGIAWSRGRVMVNTYIYGKLPVFKSIPWYFAFLKTDFENLIYLGEFQHRPLSVTRCGTHSP